MMISLEHIREQFPSLQTCSDVLLDNAGGSQVPRQVAEAMCYYMLSNYVQVGADYRTSLSATATVHRAHEFVTLMMNGVQHGHVAIGSSTTMLCAMLAECYARASNRTRNEIIVAETAHEANAGPWFRLAARGFKVRLWPIEADGLTLPLDSLKKLLGDRTRLVAFPHISNLLGRIEDAESITALVHAAGARVVIDGVAFAPHRAMDVASLGADWYLYSTYKVFGPHMAALFGTHAAFEELEGPNHFFIPKHEVPYRFEPGGPAHEGCAGLVALWGYLADLAGLAPQDGPSRLGIERAFEQISQLEEFLQARLLGYLRSKRNVRIVGPVASGPNRVPTISLVHRYKQSAEIAKAANVKGFGIRYGHFYAYRLCERLAHEKIAHDTSDGVVRVSMLHYNTLEEVERLIACLEVLL